MIVKIVQWVQMLAACREIKLTLFQATDFRISQTESLQSTILNLIKMAQSFPDG